MDPSGSWSQLVTAGHSCSATQSMAEPMGCSPWYALLCASSTIPTIFTPAAPSHLQPLHTCSTFLLQASEVKQIAGRAGRYRSAHPRGYVTCLWGDGMEHLATCLAQRSESIASACLLPR
jgi:hypothetical protein